jgi:fructose-1,6-bisphosphatase/inositol monophosphatase family enzyme
MSKELNLGPLNGPATGIILKELVRRATSAIRKRFDDFEPFEKDGYEDRSKSVFTNADTEAQEIYLRTLMECFPDVGVLAEEDTLRIASSIDVQAYFTVDPLDGTKAFIRQQSHGVGTMISLVCDGSIVAAYVGDINAKEVYGYRPGSDKVHRITDLDHVRELRFAPRGPLSENYALLRDPPSSGAYESPELSKALNVFENYNVDGGSIGTWAARLWKGEVRALFLPPAHETPWDSTPVFGICQKLGYEFLRPSVRDGGWEVFTPTIPFITYQRKHDMLILHASDISEFEASEYVRHVDRRAA